MSFCILMHLFILSKQCSKYWEKSSFLRPSICSSTASINFINVLQSFFTKIFNFWKSTQLPRTQIWWICWMIDQFNTLIFEIFHCLCDDPLVLVKVLVQRVLKNYFPWKMLRVLMTTKGFSVLISSTNAKIWVSQ